MKTVIVGCTHAGTAAVQELLKRNPNAEVDIFERGSDVSFLSCGIYLYLEGVIDNLHKVYYASADDLEALGPNVHVYLEHDVTNIDPDSKTLRVMDLKTATDRQVTYDKLVMTTGSRPHVPNIPGIHSPRIMFCKSYDDAMAIEKLTFSANRIAIIGGGYIGTEIAEALTRRGYDTQLIFCREHPLLSHYADVAITKVIAQDLIENGVDTKPDTTCTGFETDDNQVTMITNHGQMLVDMVIVCTGFDPATELVKDSVALMPNGAIKVNPYMQTSNPDIYAAGDAVAVHFNPILDNFYFPLATSAVRTGKIVGANIAAPKAMADMGTQGTSALSLFDKTLASTGLTLTRAKRFFNNVGSVTMSQNYRPDFMPENAEIMMTLVYNRDDRKILGAQFYSEIDTSMSANLISVMIQNQNTIDDLAYVDMLFNPNYNQPWHYLNLLGQAAVEQES